MALRITQGLMYNSFVSNMNRNLGNLMESNIQSSSQKKVNRPSDDPLAAGRILASRSTLDRLDGYEENINMAMGWLNLADNTLGSGDGSVLNVLSRIKVLAEAMATGSVSAENRLETSYEVRGHFEQLISLANAKYAGSNIFGGHRTDQPAYVQGLAVTCLDAIDDSIADARFHVEGALDRTMIIQPVNSGNADSVQYRYSMDGGTTWQEVDNVIPNDPEADFCTIEAGGVRVQFTTVAADGRPVHVTGVRPTGVVDEGPDSPHSNDNGTWIYVRPTAVYQGDDHDTQVVSGYGATVSATASGTFASDVSLKIVSVDIDPSTGQEIINYTVDNGATILHSDPGSLSLDIPGGGALDLKSKPAAGMSFDVNAMTMTVTGTGTTVSGEAEGYFTRDIAVRIDSAPTGGAIKYSYSVDDGNNWIQATAPAGSSSLPVPGGYLTLSGEPGAGMQFLVHPHRADINYQIGDDDSIAVNMIGKDIFGGYYDYPGDRDADGKLIKNPVPVTGQANLFETVGDLLAALETNSQQGVQEALEKLDDVMALVRTRVAEVGGRENRLISSQGSLIMRQYSEEDRLSDIEDVDVTELMTRLSQQQIAYNSVLKSSSMIMQMSLVNFL